LASGDVGIDLLGSIIDIAGDLEAPTVTINGSDHVDYIQIRNPAGINAAGATTINGGGADDRFFIPVVAGATTINGGTGADRFYISSNASRQVFTNANGAYNDDIGREGILNALNGNVS